MPTTEVLSIDNSNYGDFVLPEDGKQFGEHVRLRGTYPRAMAYGENPYARPMADDFEVIPRSEWDALIEKKDAEKSWLHDRIKDKITVDDQDGLGYCHAYGMAMAVMTERDVQGLPHIRLSAMSLGVEVTNWQNEGATLDDDLRVASELGMCEQRFIKKDHSLSKRDYEDGWKENRKHYRVVEAWDLSRPKRGTSLFDIACTCAFRDIPFDGGYLWWLHAVAGGFRVRRNPKTGKYEQMNRQSWGVTKEFGPDGFFYLGEDKGSPDLGLIVPRQVSAYLP